MNAYLTSTGACLPGLPISNDEMESYLGLIDGRPSRLRSKILRSNGIKSRHYALDKSQNTTHSVSGMGAAAARQCLDQVCVSPQSVGLLSCATTQGDLIIPGFGSMVQAELGIPEVELHTAHGVCSSSIMAVRAAVNSLRTGDHGTALVVVSELASRLFKHTRYEAAGGRRSVDFSTEFLRWMLSDGAGALLLEREPRRECLRIDWIRSFSHADAFPVCMAIGQPSDSTDQRSWQDFATYAQAEAAGALLVRQDVRLLDNIVKLGVDGLLRLIDEGLVDTNSLGHLLCHYSSRYFHGRIVDMLDMAGVSIDQDKWYTNLYTRGNTGAASILIMLDEFLRDGRAKAGDSILCVVPESARFNCAYMHLTMVAPS